MDDAATRKRPRPIVSCLRCRDKKLKCDRASPCQNCIKAQCTSTCTYSQWQGNGLSGAKMAQEITPPAIPLSSSNAVEDLQNRMAKLEEMLGVRSGLRHGQNMDQSSKEPISGKPSPQLGMLVVKGNRTIYHGPNDRITLLNQFTEVKDYINECIKDDHLQALIKQTQFLREKSRSQIASPDLSESGFSLSLLKLREFLPPKPYCDRLVSMYFQYFERTMRILHIPTFLRQYDQIWANTDPDICSLSSTMPQVTAVLAIAYHLDDLNSSAEDQIHRNYLKGAAIDLIQAWLEELTRKRRTELSTLQVEVLLLTARSLQQDSPGRLWSSTGALVRTAMVMGMHMNLAGASKLSPYQAEIRRRLWITILEMDLQASMSAGMPLVVPNLEATLFIPANIDDSEFDESSVELPESKPLAILTDNTYQVYLASCLLQRLKAMSLVQSHSSPTMDDALKHGRIIEEHLSRKPHAFDLSSVGDSTDAGRLLHSVLLDLYIRRPLLRLYRPILQDEQRDQTKYTEIQNHCQDSASKIVSYIDLHSTVSLSKVTNDPFPQQKFFYRCCKNDVLWAALSICQHLKTMDSQAEQFRPLLITSVQNTIDFLIQRLEHKDGDLKDIIFLTIALRSAQLSGFSTQTEKSHQIYETTKQTLSDCRAKLMSSVLSHDPVQRGPNPKRSRLTAPAVVQQPSIALPNTIPIITPPSTNEPPPPQLATEHPENMDQWLCDLSDLAAEFGNFQGEAFTTSSQSFNFDVAQDWNWDYMWH